MTPPGPWGRNPWGCRGGPWARGCAGECPPNRGVRGRDNGGTCRRWPARPCPGFCRKGVSVAACEGRAGCPGGQAAHARETSKKVIDVTGGFSNLISKGQQGTSVLGACLSRTTLRCGHQAPWIQESAGYNGGTSRRLEDACGSVTVRRLRLSIQESSIVLLRWTSVLGFTRPPMKSGSRVCLKDIWPPGSMWQSYG